jgi:flagellar biogenesis protein FliO
MDVWDGDGLRQLLGVLTVFALLGAVVWKFRARAGGLWRPSARSSVRLASGGRLALTPQHAVHLIVVDGRELIVATHPQGCSLLAETASGQVNGASA